MTRRRRDLWKPRCPRCVAGGLVAYAVAGYRWLACLACKHTEAAS